MTVKSSGPIYRRNFLLHLQERQEYDRPVLLKEPAHELPTAAQIAQLHNEYVITRQLEDVPGVRPLYTKEGTESHPVLLLEYIQGQSLSEIIQGDSLDLRRKLQLAVNTVEILGRIHEQNVMHKDISSSNILVAESGGVYIIDFGIATTMQQERPGMISTDDALASSLAYISPEQTGRMNRVVDYRTDIYSLGVTLCELFTGELPFQADDSLEMIHSHIARQPTPPHEIDAEIPRPVSDIILKLLAKNAEDRYQSARGLQADLQHCLAQLQATGQLEPFELGRNDFTGRLLIPQELYGRQAEIDQLLSAHDRVIQGSAELLLVAGYAGVGKTSLVREFRKHISAKRGHFVEGKFGQYRRSIPFVAWGQAFAGLVDQWQRASETELARWRGAILEAVGQNGQVLIDLIPSLELILGPQPDVPELDGIETQNRFNNFFQRFVRTVARPDQPLVVFLDDLQWIDLASLNLLKSLLAQPAEHLLLIGAYRDNEVDATHSLMLGLKDLKEAGCTVNRLVLGNLARKDINQLLSESLHIPTEQSLPLAQLVHTKTDGNAFYTHQLLQKLEDDRLLSFDPDCLCWQWDLAEFEKLTVSDNVVDLMVSKMLRLPVATQEVLKTAACLGNQFELATLSLISRQSLETTQQALQAAYQDGLLVKLDEHGRFVHDRIQEAAYSLIPEPEIALRHWQIGRTLLRETPSQAREERQYNLVGHLNLGASLIETDAERIELAELNLIAAQQALQATAYAASGACAQTAIDLLAANGWQAHYRLMLRLHELAAEVAYLNLDYERSEHYIAAILSEAHSLIDRVPAYIIQIRAYHAQNLIAEAIEIGLAALDELGLPLLESEPAGVTVQAISELAPTTDSQASAAAELLNSLVLPAHISKPKLLPSLIYTALRLNLQFGLHPSSCMIAMVYATFVWSEDIDRAYRFGQLTLQLGEKPEAYRYMCQVRAGIHSHISPWKSHYRTIEQALRDNVQIGLDRGDKSYAMSSLVNSTILNIFLRDRLDQAQENMTQDIRLLQGSGEHFYLYSLLVWTQFVVNLRGRSDDPLCFEGPLFDEASDLPLAQAAGLHRTTYYLHLLKLILHYHLGYFQAAFGYSEKAEPMLPYFLSHYLIPLLPFYQSLSILQLSDGSSQPSNLVEKLERNLQKLQLWAHHAPMNHQHKVDLILAEKARVAGDVAAAMDHYEAAIAGAKDNEYLHEEALAYELYARFWIERGKDNFAGQFMREAHALYSRWGAGAIVEHLEAQYRQWLRLDILDIAPSPLETSLAKTLSHLDLHSILKASQAIAGELEMDRLLGHIMSIIIENAGAERGFLILEQEGTWFIEAAAEIGEAKPRVTQAIPIAGNTLLSERIVLRAARTQHTVLLGDATREGEFSHDAYIQDKQVKSLLCMPLVTQGKTSAILYVENNLTTHAFPPQRVDLLTLLSTQMAMSIDSARIHSYLEEMLEKRSRALTSAEDQIRTLFESAQVGIALTTLEGEILAVNKALLSMTGYKETEIQQRNVAEFYLDPEQRTELLERLAESEAVHNFGVRLLRKDGTFFYASSNVSKLAREGQPVLLTMIEDVSRIVEAEKSLERSEHLLRIVADNYPAFLSIVEKDEQDLVVGFTSGREFKKLNLDPDAFVGQTIEEVFGDQASIVRENYMRAFMGEEVSFELFINGQNQSYNAFPLFDEIGEIDRILTVVENIDERKLLEAQLEQAAARAERDRLARELHDSVTQSLFTATLFAQAGRKGVESGDLDGASHHLTRILETSHQASKEMRLLIYELLPEQLVHLGLVEAIRARLNAVEKRTGTKVSLTAGELGDLPEPVNKALYRITQEALNNSLKHAQADEVTVTIRRQGQRLCLEIVDDGQGFDPLEAQGRGGLGLINMRERTEQFGGEFSIDTARQQGTKISVVLEVSG